MGCCCHKDADGDVEEVRGVNAELTSNPGGGGGVGPAGGGGAGAGPGGATIERKNSYGSLRAGSGGATPLLRDEKGKTYQAASASGGVDSPLPSPQADSALAGSPMHREPQNGEDLWRKVRDGWREFNVSMAGTIKGWAGRKASIHSQHDDADDSQGQEFYSCLGSETASRAPSRLGGGDGSFIQGNPSLRGGSSGPATASTKPPPARIRIEPVAPAGHGPGQGPIWASHNKEVVRVYVNDAPPRNYEFIYNGLDFDVAVNGYFIPGMKSFLTLKEMATGEEATPHAEWKVSHEDKKAGITAWTRPPPPTPWLAPPETMAQTTKMHQVRVKAEFDCPAQLLYDVLHDSTYRQKWDEKMLKGERIAELTPRADIGYYAANLPAPLSNRDFCNLRTWREFASGEYIIMNYSVAHDDCPEQSYVRAISYGSGYYLKAIDNNRCAFYSVSHTDMKASVPAWMINGKLGQISCGIIPKLREAAANYRLWQGLSKGGSVPVWRTPAVQWHGLVDAVRALVAAQETAYRTIIDSEEIDRKRMSKKAKRKRGSSTISNSSISLVPTIADAAPVVGGGASFNTRPVGGGGGGDNGGLATQPQSLQDPTVLGAGAGAMATPPTGELVVVME